MIVWLASYPRSGNTLLRLMLHRVFGIASTSEYMPARPDYGADTSAGAPGSLAAAGRARRTERFVAEGAYYAYEGRFDDFLAKARHSGERIFVKTHGKPRDRSTAIYVVRDGRAALVSYFHYLVARAEPRTLTELIVDRDASRSDQLAAWQPLSRDSTLLVRFEDLTARPGQVIDAIGGFLGVPPVDDWRDTNAELQKLDPAFFRGGSNARNIAELNAGQRALFWERHGAWMHTLGYGA